MRNILKIRQQRKVVILAAKLVESGYEPELKHHQFDPDDLRYLQVQVGKLRLLEKPKGDN